MILERLNIYGMESIEPVLLAGLAGREPILLIGAHGSAKTTLCRRIAAALGQRFWAYDASKALFEDIVGFPNPSRLCEGIVDYAPTPLSIWDKEFVLIDELSRATPAMQNKWLEVIRERTVMGRAIPGLRTVIAAMNPPSYLGAHPLDEALAGRFATIIEVPDIGSMPTEAVVKIMRNVTEQDCPDTAPSACPDVDLPGLLDTIRATAETLPGDVDALIERMLCLLAEYLHEREIFIDGRRLGMMYRTLRLSLAALRVCEGLPPGTTIRSHEHLWRLLSSLLPWRATDRPIEAAALAALLQRAQLGALEGALPQRIPPTLLGRAAALESGTIELSVDDRRCFVSRIIAKIRPTCPEHERCDAALALARLATATAEGCIDLTPDDQQRVLRQFDQATWWINETDAALCDQFNDLDSRAASFDPTDPRQLLLLRFAYGLHERSDEPEAGDLAERATLLEERQTYARLEHHQLRRTA